MTREEFERRMKPVHLGTSRTRPKTTAEESADIEQKTAEFLARGGQIKALSSEQCRPTRYSAFNVNYNADFSS